jgi:hypothetical protein
MTAASRNRARTALREPTEQSFVGRDELLQMLERAGVTIGKSGLRRYQALGLLPSPRPYGRVGRGRGVDWGWPREQAREVVQRVRLIKRYQRTGKRLVQLLAADPELSDVLNALVQGASDEAYQEGFEDGREAMRQELTERPAEPEYEQPEHEPPEEPE